MPYYEEIRFLLDLCKQTYCHGNNNTHKGFPDSRGIRLGEKYERLSIVYKSIIYQIALRKKMFLCLRNKRLKISNIFLQKVIKATITFSLVCPIINFFAYPDYLQVFL